MRLDLLLWHVGLEVEEVVRENPRPDDVDTINILALSLLSRRLRHVCSWSTATSGAGSI